MAWTAPRTWVDGELVTAAILNEQLRDNQNASEPIVCTTAGDLFYANGASSLTRLAKGSALQGLRQNSGLTAPEWFTPAGRIWLFHRQVANPVFGDRMAAQSYAASGVTTDALGGFLLPANWSGGTMDIYLYWTRTGAESSGNVVWQIQLTRTMVDGSGYATQDLGEVVYTAPAQDALKISSMGSYDPTVGSEVAGESYIGLAVRRDGDDAADTFTGVTKVLGVRLDYTAEMA